MFVIDNYLPIHMCPHFILSGKGTGFKEQLMENVLQHLGFDHIFSALYHSQSNVKLEVFHKYLKPTLKKLCEKDPDNWDKYINQKLASYHVTPHLANTETPFFLIYGRDPNLPPPTIAGTHATIPGWSWIWMFRPQITPLCTCYSQGYLR